MSGDSTLDDFGASAQEEAPFVERRAIIQNKYDGKLAGFVCRDLRRDMTVYTSLRTRRHFYRNGKGYAISDNILDRLEDVGVSRVLIHDGTTDNDDVFEFTIRDYTVDGIEVPSSTLEDPLRDPQTYQKLDRHLHKWPEYAGSLFRRPFREACERIDWRGYDLEYKRQREKELGIGDYGDR